jgi:hypothetical protein
MSTSAGRLAPGALEDGSVSPSASPERECLTVADVQARYGECGVRAARRAMDEAGAFVIAGRLLVRREDLMAHEEALRAARRGQRQPIPPPPRRPRRTRRRASAPNLADLPISFWEADSTEEGTR